MMYFCVFLLFGISSTLASLSAPQIQVVEKDSEWKVIWKPVNSTDENDPVLGYKVNVDIYVVNDKNHYIGNRLKKELYYQQVIPVNETTTELKVDLSKNVHYEFSVLAFAKSGDGPASELVEKTDSEDEEDE